MRLVIFSDLHGNIPVLEEMENRLKSIMYDRLIFLGDLAMQHHEEEKIRTRLANMGCLLVKGNSDRVGRMHKGPVILGDQLALCHGSPRDIREYIEDEISAIMAFSWLKENGCRLLFHGHIHRPTDLAAAQ
jgi:predicted phosphodiesterase